MGMPTLFLWQKGAGGMGGKLRLEQDRQLVYESVPADCAHTLVSAGIPKCSSNLSVYLQQGGGMDTASGSNDFTIGHAVIDADHAIIMDIIQQIHEGVLKNSKSNVMSTLFTHLFDYSAMHFLREELLMEKINCPLRKEHFSEHIKLMDDLKAVRRMYEEGSEIVGGVADHVCDLFATHIRMVDVHLKSYIAALGSNERYM